MECNHIRFAFILVCLGLSLVVKAAPFRDRINDVSNRRAELAEILQLLRMSEFFDRRSVAKESNNVPVLGRLMLGEEEPVLDSVEAAGLETDSENVHIHSSGEAPGEKALLDSISIKEGEETVNDAETQDGVPLLGQPMLGEEEPVLDSVEAAGLETDSENVHIHSSGEAPGEKALLDSIVIKEGEVTVNDAETQDGVPLLGQPMLGEEEPVLDSVEAAGLETDSENVHIHSSGEAPGENALLDSISIKEGEETVNDAETQDGVPLLGQPMLGEEEPVLDSVEAAGLETDSENVHIHSSGDAPEENALLDSIVIKEREETVNDAETQDGVPLLGQPMLGEEEPVLDSVEAAGLETDSENVHIHSSGEAPEENALLDSIVIKEGEVTVNDAETQDGVPFLGQPMLGEEEQVLDSVEAAGLETDSENVHIHSSGDAPEANALLDSIVIKEGEVTVKDAETQDGVPVLGQPMLGEEEPVLDSVEAAGLETDSENVHIHSSRDAPEANTLLDYIVIKEGEETVNDAETQDGVPLLGQPMLGEEEPVLDSVEAAGLETDSENVHIHSSGDAPEENALFDSIDIKEGEETVNDLYRPLQSASKEEISVVDDTQIEKVQEIEATDEGGSEKVVKSQSPGVEDFEYGKCNLQSNNFLFTPVAAKNRVTGQIVLKQKKTGGVMEIKASFYGLDVSGPVEHKIDVHEFGDLSYGCGSAGESFRNSGSPNSQARSISNELDVGLGLLLRDEMGSVHVGWTTDSLGLVGSDSIIGRAIVVHGAPKSGQHLEGTYGTRLACCTIARSSDATPWV